MNSSSITGAALLALLACSACTTGEGEGWVRSEQLFVERCWNGPFDLGPDFFGVVPHEDRALFIRVQRSDNNQEVSDGLIVLVHDLQNIRNNELGQPLTVGLPVGVSPPGVPIVRHPDPPRVNLTLYLHDTCHGQTADLYSIGGTITFSSLFSGDLNEHDSSDRLTEARFTADFADPRKAEADGSYREGLVSNVQGYFKFYFQRGQPAQPFL
jgi:hypothetical protein